MSAATHTQAQKHPREKKPLSILWKLLIVIWCLFAMFSLNFIADIDPPLRPNESRLLMAIYTSPVWLTPMVLPLWHLLSHKKLTEKDKSTKLDRAIFATVMLLLGMMFFMLPCMVLGFYIDRHFDHSPVHEEVLPIIGIYTDTWGKPGTGKHHRYYGLFPTITTSHFPFSLDETELARISKAGYEAFVPNTLKVVVLAHEGFLGIPWVESAEVMPVDAQPASVTPRSP